MFYSQVFALEILAFVDVVFALATNIRFSRLSQPYFDCISMKQRSFSYFIDLVMWSRLHLSKSSKKQIYITPKWKLYYSNVYMNWAAFFLSLSPSLSVCHFNHIAVDFTAAAFGFFFSLSTIHFSFSYVFSFSSTLNNVNRQLATIAFVIIIDMHILNSIIHFFGSRTLETAARTQIQLLTKLK